MVDPQASSGQNGASEAPEGSVGSLLLNKWSKHGHLILIAGLLLASLYTISRIYAIQREAYLGLSFDQSLRVLDSAPRLPHKAYGTFRAGDVITHINGTSVSTIGGLQAQIASSNGMPLQIMTRRIGPAESSRTIVWWVNTRLPTLDFDSDLRLRQIQGVSRNALSLPSDVRLRRLNGQQVSTLTDLDSAPDLSEAWRYYIFESSQDTAEVHEVVFLRASRAHPWVLLFIGLAFGTLGITVYRLRSGSRTALAYLWFCLSMTSLFLFRAIPGMHRLPFEIEGLTILLCSLITPSVYLASVTTPICAYLFRGRAPLACAVIYGFALWFLSRFDYRLFMLVWGASNAALLIAMALDRLPIIAKLPQVETSQSVRLNVVRFAIIASMFPSAAHLVYEALSDGQAVLQIWLDGTVLIFPLVVGYAVLRLNVLQANEMILEGTAYSLIGFSLGGAFAVAVAVVVPLVERILPGSSAPLTGAFAGGTAWLAMPLYNRAKRALEARFTRGLAEFDRFTRSVQQIGEESEARDTFCQSIVGKVSSLTKAPVVALFIIDDQKDEIFLTESADGVFTSRESQTYLNSIREAMSNRTGELSRETLLDSILADNAERELASAMAKLSVVWLFPIVAQSRLVGIFAFGNKVTDANFSRSEIAKLRIIARECALALIAFTVRQRSAEKRAAEKDLSKSEARFRRLAENAQDVIFRVRPCEGGEVDYVSPYIESLLQYSPEEFSRDRNLFSKLMSTGDWDRLRGSSKNRHDVPNSFEMQWFKRDGESVWVEVRLVATLDGDTGEVVLEGIARDITIRKRQEELESRLRHTQKMEAIGTIAAGIAHDFDNLLTAIFGFTAIGKDTLPYDHPAAAALTNVEEAAKQASGITRSLLIFTQRASPEIVFVDLARLVRETVRLLRRLIPNTIEVRVQIPSGMSVWIRGDESQIQQILLNLIVNARDSMPEGGVLTVQLEEQPKGATPSVLLSVTDSGVGMSSEVRARIFDPFFTTKPRGRGTGLGLSIVHGAVRDHGGDIQVRTGQGEGTCFTICLPTCTRPPLGDPTEDFTIEPGIGETVLIAENEYMVRAALGTALRTEGYEIMQVSAGDRFLEELDRNRDSLDLIVLDSSLRGKGGVDCLQEMQAMGWTVPVLVTTADPDFQHDCHAYRSVSTLRKPFTIPEFLACVSNLRSAKSTSTA